MGNEVSIGPRSGHWKRFSLRFKNEFRRWAKRDFASTQDPVGIKGAQRAILNLDSMGRRGGTNQNNYSPSTRTSIIVEGGEIKWRETTLTAGVY